MEALPERNSEKVHVKTKMRLKMYLKIRAIEFKLNVIFVSYFIAVAEKR